MQGQLEIISIDDRNFGEWVEAEIAVDGVRCLPYQFSRRTFNELKKNDEQLFAYLYKSGLAMNQKCGTYQNPFSQGMVEEAAA